MHEKHKIYGKNPNSNSTIGVKNPIAEHSETNRRPNTRRDTQTITDLVEGPDEPPGKHKKSFVNQKLSRQIRYISRNMDEQTNVNYSNKERLYLKKIEDYTPLDENVLCINTYSSYEPKYVIPGNFDISDEVYNPYTPPNTNSSIHCSEEIDEFIEQSKSLSMAA